MADSLAIERLQASVVDGRTENIRYRQFQLQDLHKALREASSTLAAALRADGSTPEEADAEVVLALDTVRHAYDSLNFKQELKDEYSVADGKNFHSRRVGAGLVIIRPTIHTRLYSILAPLAAAIGAGNCIIIELLPTVLKADAELSTLLPGALDIATFAIVTTQIEDEDVLESALLVDQTAPVAATENPATNELVSPVKARVVAVVDRTADVDKAARAIATARFSFGGTSPYAPDLVLVNEYVKAEFFEACSKHATSFFAKSRSKKVTGSNEIEAVKRAVKEAEDKGLAQGFGSDLFRVVDLSHKQGSLMSMKVSGRYLPIASCSSLVDAVFTYELGAPLLAGYFFADPGAAKYMAQHLPAQLACVNHIPTHLLLGPAAPLHKDPDFHYRYSKDMFSVARPQFISPAPLAAITTTSSPVTSDSVTAFGVATALIAAEGKEQEKAKKDAAAAMAKALPPVGQPGNANLGFFEQGIVVGLSVIASVALPTIGFATYFMGRKAFYLAMRFRP